MNLKFFLGCVFLAGCFSEGQCTTACQTMDDFKNPSKPPCWNNPYGDMSAAEILESWGNYVEKRHIIVGSGYNLTLIKTHTSGISPSKTVIFMPGIMMDTKGFLVTGDKSYGYAFSKAGYAIWLLSYRGVGESRKHIKYSDTSCDFWSFSLDDLVNEDVKDTINYVVKESNRKVTLLGYSMGTTLSTMYAAGYPDDAAKNLNGIVMMGPAIYLNNTPSIAWTLHDFWPIVKTVPQLISHCEVSLKTLSPSNPNPTYQSIMTQVTMQSLFFGFNNDGIDPTTITASLTQNPSSTSVKLLDQFINIMKSKKLVKYSEEISIFPFIQLEQTYELKNIKVSIAMFSGPNDYLCTATNSKEAYDDINPTFQCGYYLISDTSFTHADFVRGKDIPTVLLPNVLEKVDLFSEGKCS
ncbi:unnamed protein product [Brassicogethes aeneus]|uniref:AB hydrolase-1 domain-containing protein n=1 Tax=Brassicogethes aeneus TaxID=1431903 RepID=A0A9P0BFH4_BRAAE|nr:unnamed protein product [Brassicogethes aeneus]